MIIVVGGGIAGVACARTLADGGAAVRLLDRGRRLGGRLGERDYDLGGHPQRPVDTGGSYFTVSDPAFERVVEDWHTRGLARPWTDTFSAIGPDGEETKSGPMRWAAQAGLRGLVADLAAGLDVRSGVRVGSVDTDGAGLRVSGDDLDETAETVVLAMPDPQAQRLLGPGLARHQEKLGLGFEPVLVLTAIWPRRSWPDRDGAFVNDDEVLAWIADDGLRRGDRAPVLVAHSTTDFARPRLEDPQSAAGPMLEHLRRTLGIEDEPDVTAVQRWSFARPVEPRDEPYLLTDDGLAACGDGWAAKPNVEAAFVSGVRLGRALLG